MPRGRPRSSAPKSGRASGKAKIYRVKLRSFIGNDIKHFKQTVGGNHFAWTSNSRTLSQPASAGMYNAEFTLGALPQLSSFTSLFDQYRINKIVVRLVPLLHMAVTTDTTTYGAVDNTGIIATAIDYDGGTISTLDEITQYPTCKIQSVVNTKPIVRKFTPKVLIGGSNTGGSITGSVNKAKQWIDCAQTAVTHFGLKIYMDGYANTLNKGRYDVTVTYYISFRNTH